MPGYIKGRMHRPCLGLLCRLESCSLGQWSQTQTPGSYLSNYFFNSLLSGLLHPAFPSCRLSGL